MECGNKIFDLKWLLVEYTKRDDPSPYAVVRSDYVRNEGMALKVGTVVIVVDKLGRPAYAKILKISDDKNTCKEHKFLMQNQDKKMKLMLQLCLNSIWKMKGNMSNSAPNSSVQPVTTEQVQPSILQGETSSESDSDVQVNSTVNRPSTSAHHTSQHRVKREASNVEDHTRQKVSRLANPNTTANQPKTVVYRDQQTQTEDSISPSKKTIPLNDVNKLQSNINDIYNTFVTIFEELTLKYVINDPGRVYEDNAARTTETLLEVFNIPKAAQGVMVRRVSAHTTNEEVSQQDGEMVPIGSGHARVPERLLREIDWTSYTHATRVLLQAIFPRKILATHSLTGKQSPAFLDKPPKKRLDPKLVNDIVVLVTERCGVAPRLVRNIITIKCTDESKLYRNRLEFKRRSSAGRGNQENQPPTDESSADTAE